MNNTAEKGMWCRTFRLYTNIKIPFVLYILSAVLGLVATKVTLIVVPYESEVQLGNLEGNATRYLLLLIVAVVCQIAARIPEFYTQALVTKRLQNKLISRSVRLPLKNYESKASQIVSWITQDCALADGLLTAIVGFITGVLSTGMTISSMNSIQAGMTHIIIIIAVYIVFSTWLEGKLLFLRQRRDRRAISELTAYFSEHLAFLTEIKQQNTREEEKTLARTAIKDFFNADVYAANMTLLNSMLSGSITDIITILVFVFGVREVNAGNISLTDLVAFQSYALMLYQSIAQLPGLYTSVMMYNGSLFYISGLMDEKEEMYDRSRGAEGLSGDMELSDVSFSYSGRDDEVLHSVDVRIPEKGFTVIVGPNGSGKSTVLKLLDRLYEPTSGRVLIGGEDTSDVSLTPWRRRFAYVLQDSQIFNASIRDNLCYGLDSVPTDEELDRVTALTEAKEFIHSVPEGYDFITGEDGARLSGGQKQRIAIARALLTDPEVLILDEATSNMDHELAGRVIDTVRGMMKDKSLVMITHDMDVLEKADYVVVMADGRVEACGSPEEVSASPTLKKLTGGTTDEIED